MGEFARLKLGEASEEEVIEDRCTEFYRVKCQQSVGESRYRLAEWLDWMDLEIDNIRAVLGRCLARRDALRGIDLATPLGWYWITPGTAEGGRRLDDPAVCGQGHPRAQLLA